MLGKENLRQDIEVDESSYHLDSSSSSVFFLHAIVRWKGSVETKVALGYVASLWQNFALL